ncbi:cell division cycle 7-related protein kinase-like isoform X1 [Cataglyphis hispanica]|uniref:cell division cycle 7-related protein kinase-like isoform X1 n=1 Tax=Cataglyphis hispanica TaxID=1086592 RepID=UPI00217FF51B|nr:cell division cycle 7-related protein kinase-like isoform X1 [Cataglyphis hispanica]
MEINNLHQNDKIDNDAKDSCTNLKKSIPLVNELFHVHCKVGDGTFSSVFLATLKSSNRHKKFALKHLIPTCHPERIERELQCLQQIGGKDHIVGIDLCLRNHGSVVFVMPYMKHDKFSEYVKDMTVEETKDYMRALLSAVRRVHQFNIMHRDVKPSNFLYNRMNRKYLLVDFGLAQQYTEFNAKNLKTTKIINEGTTEIQSMKRKRSDENNSSFQLNSSTAKKNVDNKCNCFGKPKVCTLCLTRPQQTAPRAGTPGFRAPEVLLKHPSQTPAIDIWACGVMMLCILSGTQVFFRSPDDCTALAEITTIFGSRKVEQCAEKLGKKIIFSENLPGIDIMSLCLKLRKRNRSMMYENSICKVLQNIEYPKEAYQLLTKLLDLDYTTRITAEQALSHPFLSL